MHIGDKIKLHPKTGKGKQVIHRDGDMFEVLGFEETVHFDDGTDWINLQSIDNPKTAVGYSGSMIKILTGSILNEI